MPPAHNKIQSSQSGNDIDGMRAAHAPSLTENIPGGPASGSSDVGARDGTWVLHWGGQGARGAVGDHGCAVRARPVCVSVGGVSGRVESVQRPLFMRLWAATRASPRAQVRCVLGFHAVHAYPGRGWPREGLAKHQESVTAIDSIIPV